MGVTFYVTHLVTPVAAPEELAVDARKREFADALPGIGSGTLLSSAGVVPDKIQQSLRAAMPAAGCSVVRSVTYFGCKEND